MNQTLSKNFVDSDASEPESSGSFKTVDKKQKKDRSSTKSQDEIIETLRRRLEEVESENRQLHEMNSACNRQLEEQLAYRQELKGVREELEQLRIERDKAIYRASELTIESGKVSESYDRVAESKVVIEQLREMLQTSLAQQSTSTSMRSVSKNVDRWSLFRKLGSLFLLGFRNKNDDKTVVSTCDDDSMLDPTDDSNSIGSEYVLELEQAKSEEESSVVYFTDNLNCSSDQLYNRRLLKAGLILDSPKRKKEQ
jgi:hypothetical protein